MSDARPFRTASARGMWIALGVVLCLFVVPYLYGATLPDEFVGRVRARFGTGPRGVWEELVDHRAHPLSGGRVTELVELASGDDGPAWEERMRGGMLAVRTVVRDAPHRLERVATDAANGIEARWAYRLVALPGGGTELTVTQETRVIDPGFTTPYYRLFFAWLDFAEQAPARQIDSLAAALGEPEVTPRPEETDGASSGG